MTCRCPRPTPSALLSPARPCTPGLCTLALCPGLAHSAQQGPLSSNADPLMSFLCFTCPWVQASCGWKAQTSAGFQACPGRLPATSPAAAQGGPPSRRPPWPSPPPRRTGSTLVSSTLSLCSHSCPAAQITLSGPRREKAQHPESPQHRVIFLQARFCFSCARWSNASHPRRG